MKEEKKLTRDQLENAEGGIGAGLLAYGIESDELAQAAPFVRRANDDLEPQSF